MIPKSLHFSSPYFYSKTPNEIYEIITYMPAQDMAGTGIGRKSLQQLSAEKQADAETFLSILKEEGIEAEASQSLKEIASENDMPAKEIYELIMQ